MKRADEWQQEMIKQPQTQGYTLKMTAPATSGELGVGDLVCIRLARFSLLLFSRMLAKQGTGPFSPVSPGLLDQAHKLTRSVFQLTSSTINYSLNAVLRVNSRKCCHFQPWLHTEISILPAGSL